VKCFRWFSALIGFLLAASCLSFADSGEKNKPIEWWINISPNNSYEALVTVRIRDGFCLKPNLQFSAEYFDYWGQILGTLNETFPNEKNNYSKICSGTYSRKYRLQRSAGTIRGGLMHYYVMQSPPRPYVIHGWVQSPPDRQ
jgi:hypothetical protein